MTRKASPRRRPPLVVERWKTVGGQSDVTPLSLTDTRVELRVERERDDCCDRLLSIFPRLAGVARRPAYHSTLLPDTAYMEVDVPPGSHRVDAIFGNTRLRTTANWVSAASLLLWLGILGWSLVGDAYTASGRLRTNAA